MSKETCLIGLLILSIIALLIFIYSLVWSIHEYKVIERKKLYKLWSVSHLTVFRAIIASYVAFIDICVLVIISCIALLQG